MRTGRDDSRMLPDIGNAGIFQLLFQPGELVRELLPHGRCDFLSMAGLMNERRERYFQHLRLSKAFEFPTRRTMSIACRMARCRRLGWWAPGHVYQLVFY